MNANDISQDKNWEPVLVECYSGYKANERPLLCLRDAAGKFQKYWIAGMKAALSQMRP